VDAPADVRDVPAEVREFVPSLGYAVMHVEGPATYLTYGSLALSGSIWFRPGFEVAVGGRIGYGNELDSGAVEAFGALLLAPHFKTAFDEAGRKASWRPAAGFEFGLSTAWADPRDRAAGAPFDPQPGLFYGVLVARPLRFGLTHFNASAFGLSFGTYLQEPGTQLRIQLELLTIGVIF
jgi:hypothetical protein